jgi:hypothetical protein
MESTHSTRRLPVVAFAGLVLALGGCGGGNDYKNELRPPSPINVTAYVSPNRVSVSPNTFGAGPIVVVVTNQSPAPQEITFTDGGGKVTQSTHIDPGNTGELKLDVPQGSYSVRTGSDTIRAATVTVGPQRQSAQNQLLQP